MRQPVVVRGRGWAVAVAASVLLGPLACASAPGAGGGNPEQAQERLQAAVRLAGAWVLDEAATAQAAGVTGTRPEDHITQRASDMAMAMLREQSSGSRGVSGTPEGLRRTMLLAGVAPRSLVVALGDEAITVSFDAEAPIEAPLAGQWARADTPQGPVEARLRWQGDNPAFERRVPGGGVLRDGLSILESGHLLLAREVVWGRDARSVGRLVYGRSELPSEMSRPPSLGASGSASPLGSSPE